MRVLLILLMFTVVSCVPMKQYKSLKGDYELTSQNKDDLVEKNRILNETNTEANAQRIALEKKNKDLESKLDLVINSRDQIEEELVRLKRIAQEWPDMSKASSNEIKQLLEKIRNANLELIDREKIFNNSELKRRENQQRLLELEKALKNKELAVALLKKKVSDALLGFEKDGLSVNIKNGKVYVSVEDKLLFKSGSWSVGTKGKLALKKLANVLAKNIDINIMVEGHTDNVPYKGNAQIRDNWDLSVKRSTAIIRIILNNSNISPKRLIAAGRSKYCPLEKENTLYARARNRRTEIILTPKLDEVLKMLEN